MSDEKRGAGGGAEVSETFTDLLGFGEKNAEMDDARAPEKRRRDAHAARRKAAPRRARRDARD